MKKMIKQMTAVLFAVVMVFAVLAATGEHAGTLGAEPAYASDYSWVVTFDAGEGSGYMPITLVENNTEMVLPECNYDPPEGKEFYKWVFNKDGGSYDPGDRVLIDDAWTFTATWVDSKQYTASFENNGHGVKPDDQTWLYNAKLTEPKLSADGWLLDGWYRDSSFSGKKWDFDNDKLRKNITLYAKWVRPITNINFKVDVPAPGASIEPMVQGQTDEYMYVFGWLSESDQNAAESPFKKGQCYVAYYMFKAKPDFGIDIDKLKVTINGSADLINGPSVAGEDDSNLYEVSTTFHALSDKDVSFPKAVYMYSGKKVCPEPVVRHDGKTLKKNVDYAVSYKNNTNVGKATITVTGKNRYFGSVSSTFTISKAANKLSVKGKTVSVKYKVLKRKAKTLAVNKVITFKNKGQGTLSYAKKSGNKKITINKRTGKVTVKKGLKKGTYKVTVKVKAAGNGNYKASERPVTFKVRVK